MDALLKQFFGFSAVRPYQREVINQVINGRDCLVVMATGAGKSLCYQLPPLITQKTCIVVSPLLSLMQDQVMSLRQKGVSSDYLGSTQTNPDVTNNALNGFYNVLYMTPERAMALTNRFWTKMLSRGVCLFAVDEAHCISEWGHDFRVEYKRLHLLRRMLPGVPFMALTATATQRVRSDIAQSLSLHEPYVYIGSFDRPNLFYGVKLIKGSGRSASFINDIINDLSRCVAHHESAIIYCATVRDTEQVHSDLESHGIRSCIYHGQMESSDRELSHKWFVTDEVRVMVATIAFGMGIDKPDVRCVIHYGCPKSLESYYQESGRCGRDGQPSVCWLYYQRSDFSRLDFYCSEIKSEAQKTAITNSFIAGQKYCTLSTCRRQNLLNYFGEDRAAICGNCDICNKSDNKEKDLTSECNLLISCIKACGSRWGLNLPINVLRGSKSKKIVENKYHELPIHGVGRKYTLEWWKGLGGLLLEHGFLSETVNGSFRVISVSGKGYNCLDSNNRANCSLVFKLPPHMSIEEAEPSNVDDVIEPDDSMLYEQQPLSNEEFEVYEMLVEVRKKLADDLQIAPYTICGDQVLRSIATIRPSTRENLALVDGVNLYFVTRYSAIIIDCVKDISEDLNLSLDNMALDETKYDTEESFVQGWEDDEESGMTFVEIKESVGSLICSNNGVSLSYITANYHQKEEELVVAAIVDLESHFEIYEKNGLYFAM